MWTPCPTHLDTPILVFGLEPEDLGVVMMAMLFSGVFFPSLFPVLVVTTAVAAGLWTAKRGRAPGALIHTMHALDILPIPGVLRAAPRVYSPWPPAPEGYHGNA